MALKRKTITIGKFGWKRVFRNTLRFGWVYEKAIEETETTTTTTYETRIEDDRIVEDSYDTTSTRVFVHLVFYRDKNWYYGMRLVSFLEFLYNIIFFFRRIAGKLIIPLFIFSMIFGTGSEKQFVEDYNSIWGSMAVLVLLIWILGIIFEQILARIAHAHLRQCNK